VFSIITDGQTLLFILVLLYLIECLAWVKKQSVAFVSNWGRSWRVTMSISWLGNANGAMMILNPLPPPGRVFLSHLLPISISPAGICAFNSQTLPSGGRPATQTGEFISFSSIDKTRTDGAYLVINDQKFAKCATPKQAKALASFIEKVHAAKASRREALITSWIANQFDAKKATKLRDEGEKEIGPIRWMCSLFFVFLFVATPILVTFYGLENLIIPIAVAMVLLAMQIAFVFWRAHRKFYPGESQERLENVVKMILCPPVSLRAADVLTKNLLAEFSPVAVASVLAGPGEQQFVRGFVLDLQHPLKHELTDQKAAETVSWMSARQLSSCLTLVERVDRFQGVLNPAEREGESVAYCPRCGVQFVVDEGECSDCPGVELVVFVDQQEIRIAEMR
jgi:hypothetical protein